MNTIKLPIAELKPALVGLGKIISKRSTLPILGMVKLERTRDGWITLTGTDLDSFATVRLEEPTKGSPETILVPYEDVCRITKKCTAGEALTIGKAEGDKAIITYPIGNQTGEEHVESLPPLEFPDIPKLKGESLPLNSNIRSAVLEAFQCAGTDPTRVILHGAYIDVSDRQCNQVVGTDARHLYASNSFNLPLKNSVLIPNHKLLAWKEFNNDGEWQICVDGKSQMQITTRRWRLITRQIEGNYPNWRQTVPGNEVFKTTVAFINAKDIAATIERIPCKDKENHRISLVVKNQRVFLIGQTDEKAVEVEISETTAQGKDVQICLNRNHLLQAMEFGLGQLQMSDGISSMLFGDGNGRKMVVMPINTQGPEQTNVTKTGATNVTESNGSGSSAPVHSETNAASTTAPTTERKTTMVIDQTNADTSDANSPVPKENPIEESLELIETFKINIQDTLSGLKDLSSKLKQIQKDRKTSDKEMQTVRNSIRSLQLLKV